MEQLFEALKDFLLNTGFAQFAQGDNYKYLIMIVIACFLLYLAIVKKY